VSENLRRTTSSEGGVIIAGKYQLGKLLGAGGSGQVFRARDLRSGDRVAIKVLHSPLCKVPDALKRFEREFEVTQRILHPNVVRGLDLGVVSDGPFGGTWFLVMELLEGKRVSEVLEAGPLPTSKAARITLDVAQALAAAHGKGVVHRDVEPGNVILTRTRGREVAKVLDFGLARLQTASGDTLTDYGIRLGTPEFMAPEYVKTGQLDARSDMYALGALLYTMLTGAPPFVGRSFSVMQEHVRATPAPPSLRIGGLPPWLEALTLDLLAKDPELRPTADRVVVLLEEQLAALTEEDRGERRARATLTTEAPPPPASVGHRVQPETYRFDLAATLRALVTPQVLALLAGCGLIGFVGSLTLLLLRGAR
jgi:eukaryotic-like serine/threonine-protein kinase